MASILARLSSLFPNYRTTYAPQVETAEERAARVLASTREQIDRSRARPRPSTEERIPQRYDIAGKIWFLPYNDSTTKDSPEIRAAMRLMRRDGYVKAAWEPQILTVASEDWQIQPSEPGNPESEEQAAAFKTAIEDYIAGGIVSLVRAIAAPFGSEGYCLAEPVWGYAERGKLEKMIVPTAVKARDADPECGVVRLDGDRFGNLKWVTARREPEQPRYPIEDFIYQRYLTVFDEPLGEAAFRPAYGPYWMRDTVRKLRIVHHEKRMAGMLVGTYEDDDDKGPLEAAMTKAKSATWMSIPAGTRVEALALSTASEPDYKSFDESLRDEIVQAIAFATLQILQGNVPDARGDTQVQKSMADLAPWLLMVLVTDAVNSQLSPRFIDYNYPYPAGGGYPKLTFGAVSNQELLELVQLLQSYQQLGFNPSKKHYAKALSVQEADPNDPDDSLTPPGQGAGMGGFGLPPEAGGGLPAGLPPEGPGGGSGGYLPFSEGDWESFAWQQATTERGTVKAVWSGPGQRRPLYGQAAKAALAAAASRGGATPATTTSGTLPAPKGPPKPPEPPHAPKPPHAPAPVSSPLAPPAPSPRKSSQAVRAVGRGTKKAAKAVARGTSSATLAAIYGGSKVAQGVGYAAKKLGEGLQNLGWVDRNLLFGAGRSLEKSGRRTLNQARTTAALALAGRGAAAKRAATALSELVGIQWVKNRRKYGFVPATVMEAAYWGIKYGVGIGALAAGVGTGLVQAAPVAIGAVKAIEFGAKNILGLGVSQMLRAAIAMPFRKGRGKRGKKSPQRKLAKQMAKGKMIAAPVSQVEGARGIARRSGPGPLYVPGQATTRSRRFAELPEEPLDLIVATREMIDELYTAEGQQPPELSDEELGTILAGLVGYTEKLADQAGDEVTAFAEEYGERAAWECFGWQAARARTGNIKAVGTGKDGGRTLYGAKAKEALARTAGASKRQDAPRTVRYNVTDPEGNVRKKRETNVSPERARAMAIASKVAAIEGGSGGERPTDVKVGKARPPKVLEDAKAELATTVAAAAGGDENAHRAVVEHAQTAIDTAAKGLAELPAPPPAIKGVVAGAWAKAAAGAQLPPEVKAEGKSLLAELSGGFHDDVGGAAERFAEIGLKVTKWIGKLGLATAKLALKAIGKTIVGIAKIGLRVLGSDVIKPFAYWAGAMLSGAALAASPVIAFNLGLIPFGVGLGLAIPAVAAGFVAARHIGRKAADAGLKAKGEGFIVPNSELADYFGENAGSWTSFAWDEWQQIDGGKWKSPGGRVLSDVTYQRLKGDGGGRPKAQGAKSKAPDFAPPKVPEAGRVYELAPHQIEVDPERFQFKLNTDAKTGVGKELAGVERFDPDLAGVIAVWHDPESGKTYVVNGHHRLELAKRTGAKNILVRYIKANTAEEARAKGALINIAEGRGTAVDAAKFLRDTGRSAEDLAAVGVSLKGQVARDAVDLSKLNPELFRRVAVGMIEPERGVALARHLSDPLDQQRLLSAVEKQEQTSGRPVSNRVVEAMAQEMRDAPKLTNTQETLFGPLEQDESVYFHRAELKSYIRNELAKEAKDFRIASSTRRAEALKSVQGNSLATDANKKVADTADAHLEAFDAGARLKGPLSDLLNEFAVEYANASSAGRAALRQSALGAVRSLLSSGHVVGPPRVEQRGPGLFD